MNRYQIIYADVPWSYDDKKGNLPKLGGITYPTMSLDDLRELPIINIADRNSVLFLWATMPMLREALILIASWGFEYRTCGFNWIKLNPTGSIEIRDRDIILRKGIYSGLGHWVNGNAELCLFGKCGHPKRVERNVKQILFAPRTRHSQKPYEVRDRIVRLMGDLPRIELFAREKVSGWDCLGFDIDGRDIRDSLNDLIKGDE